MNQWEAIARNYAEERDSQSLPAILVDGLLLELARKLAPGTALDFGAGTGTLAKQFHLNGWNVVAYEPNAPMRSGLIKRFADESSRISIFEEPNQLFDLAALDLILCVNVFDHVDDVLEVLRLFRRLIAPGGKMLLCIPHPLKNHGCWVKERNTGTEDWRYLYYRLEDYLKEGTVKRDRENAKGDLIIRDVVSQHRTISTYFNWIREAGFLVDRMYEPQPAIELENEFPAYFQQSSRIPYFWILDCSPT